MVLNTENSNDSKPQMDSLAMSHTVLYFKIYCFKDITAEIDVVALVQKFLFKYYSFYSIAYITRF